MQVAFVTHHMEDSESAKIENADGSGDQEDEPDAESSELEIDKELFQEAVLDHARYLGTF